MNFASSGIFWGFTENPQKILALGPWFAILAALHWASVTCLRRRQRVSRSIHFHTPAL